MAAIKPLLSTGASAQYPQHGGYALRGSRIGGGVSGQSEGGVYLSRSYWADVDSETGAGVQRQARAQSADIHGAQTTTQQAMGDMTQQFGVISMSSGMFRVWYQSMRSKVLAGGKFRLFAKAWLVWLRAS